MTIESIRYRVAVYRSAHALHLPLRVRMWILDWQYRRACRKSWDSIHRLRGLLRMDP